MIDKEYLTSLNPKGKGLIFGCRYALYLEGKYIGTAVWTKDEIIGDSFQTISDNNVNVFLPDKWELIN